MSVENFDLALYLAQKETFSTLYGPMSVENVALRWQDVDAEDFQYPLRANERGKRRARLPIPCCGILSVPSTGQ